MQIQWYPGHMAKAKRQLEERLRLVDAVIELCDARAPRSTRNPDLERLARNKPRLLVLNKADLAEPAVTRRWLEALDDGEARAIAFTGTSAKGVKELDARVGELVNAVVERKLARGMQKTVRVMVVGIPNVGKSTLINRYIGRNRAGVADKPGVTRGAQWLRVSEHLELMDTPGLLWPKLDDPMCAENLAFIGSIRDDILDTETLAALLLKRLTRKPQLLKRFYIEDIEQESQGLLEAACRGRGWIRAGGVPDTVRGAAVVLDEFRQGRCGAVTLEEP